MSKETNPKELTPKSHGTLPTGIKLRLKELQPRINLVIRGARVANTSDYQRLGQEIAQLVPLTADKPVQADLTALSAAILAYAQYKELATNSYMQNDLDAAGAALQQAAIESTKIARMPIINQFWWD